MDSQPPFVLSGPSGVLIADGIERRFSEVSAAQAALHAGHAPIMLGALPFDISQPAALIVPRAVRHTEMLPDWPSGPLPAVRVAAAIPSPEQHRVRVQQARSRITAPDSTLSKVVLARALQLAADAPLDARAILRRLVAADPATFGYLVDLTPAGGRYSGATIVGASPELLVARDGERITCCPFAGSAPRAADPRLDEAVGTALANSAKNRHEHQLVVEAMRAALHPLCDDLTIAQSPQLRRTPTVWHLSTPISGRLRDRSTTAIDLALALHPTPAVGGVPTTQACELITALEGDRGFYAGAVGWCDARGDGRWVVSIRGAQLSADRRSALAHAGGGIVAESDPDDEVDETTTKFATILAALGVQH
ncbi:isochorismate synthase [Mycobacterium heckeshornense]|uniref:isochorismate synthase n=1 Tax=Mycobacterium heckeshornense TaxID=110505 RepID=A0A2G8B5V5_9MYCO|nr:isochorismate synthase [Mycobacterium heckeshornense]KMV22717.1 isochorismate synthase [Mycobacterium heckeshornense]MCV7033931.1 isochorismate synthase [Mycobacterium heckeshornense]PIJ33165.1 isochorismate synthase [Mycobacterium heckeshornense]BCO37264.1 putative isochorismate synthase MenF [Mycobacterium heckeshornense]